MVNKECLGLEPTLFRQWYTCLRAETPSVDKSTLVETYWYQARAPLICPLLIESVRRHTKGGSRCSTIAFAVLQVARLGSGAFESARFGVAIRAVGGARWIHIQAWPAGFWRSCGVLGGRSPPGHRSGPAARRRTLRCSDP